MGDVINMADIAGADFGKQSFDDCCFRALVDITQELNAVWKGIQQAHGTPEEFVRKLSKELKPEDFAALSFLMWIHGKNMAGFGNTMQGYLNDKERRGAKDRAAQLEKEFLDRKPETIIEKYMGNYGEVFRALDDLNR